MYATLNPSNLYSISIGSHMIYSALPKTGATQTMKTNQMAELKQIPTFSNPASQMFGTKQ